MKNSFDDILKKKWDQFQFPVDNDHRNEMISLLDQQKRRKTGLFWWLSGMGGAILITTIILLMNQQETDSKLPPAPQTQQLRKETIVQSNDRQVLYSDQIAPHKNDQERLQIETLPEGNQNAISTPSSKPEAERKEQVSFSNNGNEKDSDIKNNPQRNSEVAADQQTNSIGEESISIFPVGTYDERKSNSDQSDAKSANEDFLTTSLRENLYSTEELDVLDINELDYDRKKLKRVNPVMVKRHSFDLLAEAGFGFIPASKPEYASGWNLKTGGGLYYGLNSKQSISLSVGYMLQKGGFDFERSSTVYQPAFGARSNFHSLSPDKLHFVYAKLGIHHKIRRHLLSAFGGTQYLYGAQGTIVIQTQDQLTGLTSNSKYAWLNLDGMNRWLWSGEVHYGYRLTPKASLHVGLKYNFTTLEAIDPSLVAEGYYWDGKISSISPVITIHYHLYGKK